MRYTVGNLLEAETQSLVNTVNTVGVMGKGIALQFKERFPKNFKIYAAACKNNEAAIGKMLVVKETVIGGEKIIVNFPTKTDWKSNSKYSYIEEGLKDLVKIIEKYTIKSIAIPPLGCGNGGLEWDKVKELMEQYLNGLSNIDIVIYQPNDAIKAILQKESEKKEVKLTDGRAMLLYALYTYEKLGEVASVFAANKLAYFLQKSGENLKLQFEPYTYGPYAQALSKVLYNLNGKYLRGMEQMEAKPFEPLQLNWEKYDEVENYVQTNLSSGQRQRLDDLFTLIEGFESTLALEILATIQCVRDADPTVSKQDLFEKVQNWSDRKKNLIKEEYVDIALEHLSQYGAKLHFT
jgi:O-acetyl-ADP-ribose deacetylase (regulator of RNase III)